MNARISIGSSYADTLYILGWVFGGVFALIALIVAAAAQSLLGAAILGGIAGIFFLLAILRGMVIARGRRWITATRTGFVLEDHRGEFEFEDDQISDLGTWSKVKFSNGAPKAVVRTGALFIRADEFASRLEFKYEFPLNEEDPLGKFMERNVDRLTAEAHERLAAGRDVSGDDWVLDKAELTYADKREDRAVPLEKLSAVDIVDGNVCVWRTGEPVPVVKVPAASPNALILYRVLSKRFEGTPAVESEDDGSLGRIIFERDKSVSVVTLVFLFILAGVLTLIAIGLGIAGMTGRPKEPAMLLVGGGLIVLAAAIVFAGLYFRVNIFRCHAFGVARITTRGEKSVRFKDVRVFTYSATRNYVNGAYQGTAISLKFEAQKGESLSYSATFKNADDEIDNLREHVSKVIAGHMLKKLKDGRSVQWTDRVRFTEEGLEIAGKSGLFGKGDDQFVPYEDVADATLNAGNFSLIVSGRKKPVYETPVSTPNFFPGYVLLILVRFTPDEPPVKARRADDSDPDDFKRKPKRPRDDFDD